MNFSMLASLDGTFKSFFASLATSISYDIIFYAALAVEVFIILIFAIKSKYAYEIRMTKALDKINRWLFHYKTITKDNVKEFTNLMKKAPKRLTYNWQQYILYRDKAPSEYMSIDNIIDKPLRTSSYNLNVRNMNIITMAWAFVVVLATFAYNNASENTFLSPAVMLSTLVIPFLMSVILVLVNIVFSAKKASNIDELYQNLHLFNRFVDNACTELPKYIDYSLLFTNQEIERGIPELREYYENRARKEKEEFEKAREAEEELEKYDFSAVGIDGSNILERALKECEIFLNKKAKILTSIAERESSLESLKKSFDNIQKEFQKKMQVSKENIDRLRQQQEETTSRIEGNFLRRQMESTIAKQEGEEAEYENQKRNYLAQKAEYEEQIKAFTVELDKLRDDVTVAMESEYETFYEKLFKASVVDAENKVRERFDTMREERDNYEEELTDSQTKLKRLIDENETLRNKLGITETSEILLAPQEEEGKKKKKEPKPEEELFFDHSNDEPIKAIKEEKPQDDGFMLDEAPAVEEKKEEAQPVAEEFALDDMEEQQETVEPKETEEPFALEEATEEDDAEEDEGETEEGEGFTLEEVSDENEYDMGDEGEEAEKEAVEEPEEKPVAKQSSSTKARGRPKGTTKPKKIPEGPKKSRGRPKGTTKPAPKATGEKKSRGRPKKAEGLDKITQRINEEEMRMIEAQKNLDNNLKEAVKDLETKSVESLEREKINQEIKDLKEKAKQIKNSSSSPKEIEEINNQIEKLLSRIQSL